MNAKIDISLPEEISMEKTKYFEILYHLTVNSIKFKCKNDSKINLQLFYEPIKDLGMIRRGWKGYLKTVLVDNGKGIPKKTQDTLLYTFKGNLGNMKQGVGIGLSTARAITEAVGGNIRIKSQKGDGTTITFTTLVHSKDIAIDQKQLMQ